MPSQMEYTMETKMFMFYKFAGDKGYLTKEDLRLLMEKKFPELLENQKDPFAVDKIMKDLDQCQDSRVGFQSVFLLIAGLTITCNAYFVVHMEQKGKKQAAPSWYSCSDTSSLKGCLRNLCPTACHLYKNLMSRMGPLENVQNHTPILQERGKPIKAR
ncbi:protein S100-A10-like [Sturnira hondurensis]|uniref:protein S100-A10-like n=1 Tax=Sturnira hondurensis TaxID=192404 RepID=UPI00187A2F0B|nr:protein S100-A10-like [Sturnira hondurensis]